MRSWDKKNNRIKDGGKEAPLSKSWGSGADGSKMGGEKVENKVENREKTGEYRELGEK